MRCSIREGFNKVSDRLADGSGAATVGPIRRFHDIEPLACSGEWRKGDVGQPPGGASMNRGEFIRRVRRYANKTGQHFSFDQRRGKGSHGTVWLENRHAIVRHGEIPKGVLSAMLRQLGIDREGF